MNTQSIFNVIIADDHEFFREGLEAVLNTRSDLHVIAHAIDGNDLIRKVEQHRPALAIVDITMPRKNGIDATEIITQKFASTKVIGLSMHNDDTIIIKMMKAGAMGFIDKTIKRDELFSAIDHVLYKHERYISDSLGYHLLDDPETDNTSRNIETLLGFSEREMQVLKLLIEEKTIKEMASELYLSPKTIEGHRTRIMKRMNVKSMAGMVAFAFKHNLI